MLKYDEPSLVLLLGIVSTIPFEVTTRIFMLLGFSKYSLYQLDSLVITINRPNIVIGLMVSAMVGGFTAVILYYATEKVGKDYLAVKAVALSLLAWSILEVIVSAVVEGKTIPVRPIGDYYGQALGSVIFGIALALLLKKYVFERPVNLH